MMHTTPLKRIAVSFIGLGLLVASTPAHANRLIQNTSTGRVTSGFQVTCDAAGGFTHWDRRTINFFHNTANQGSNKAAALAASMTSWTNVSSADHQLVYAGTSADGFATDGRNTILWASGNGCTGNCLALTALVLQTGQVIVETDITFNNDRTWTTGSGDFDTQAVATHELGHALGIHHTELSASPLPTMFASYFGTDGRSLEADDQNALRCSESRYPIRALAVTNAASFSTAAVAPESIAAAFGTVLATTTASAGGLPLPTTLGGTYVRVIDSAGVEQRASLYFVSPTQVNFLVPNGTATGVATVVIVSANGDVSRGTRQVNTVAPGVFFSGSGLAAAQILRVDQFGGQTFENVVGPDGNPIPINFGPPSDTLYLILYATGVRFRSSLGAVSMQVGGTSPGVLFADPQGTFVGQDQVNAGPLDRGLAGAGSVNVVLTVDGATANTVTIVFQ